MKLTDLVKIDNRFEKSVNLLLDLHVQEKIDGYIPTRSSVGILGEYIDEITHYSGNRATVLIGPYGKGKSHLLLVLFALISQSCQQSATEKLIKRIDAVNHEVAEKIRNLLSDAGPFLPVIINPSSGSLNQAFMKGLTKALERDGLNDIIPDSYYSKAIETIENWKNNFPATYQGLENQLCSGVPELVKGLSRFNETALNTFCSIYPVLTSGAAFNPTVDDEVISVYRSVNRALREKYSYAGIYIVFDEFSKYIEGHPVNRFAEDMKVLQDMCELANASKEEQLHLTCVAHKSIKAYGNTLPQEVINAFKGVEGRLREVYFVVSSQNNYELISDAISKKKRFTEWAQQDALYQDIVESTYSLRSFNSLFTATDFREIVGRGCFPLTPVAAMLLLHLSERIAQNERTIFTFIASKDRDGLARTIEHRDNAGFVGVDTVFDYFTPLFKEENDSGIHHEWLKADYALSKTSDAVEQAIIKTIAVIHMVNRPDEIVPKDAYIRLSLGWDDDTLSAGIARLVAAQLIEFKPRTGIYEFKNNIGIDIETAIADTITKRFQKVDVCRVLADNIREKCILPKKHNTEFCMTRYFNYSFMTGSQFVSMKSTKYLEWENHPDGVIVFIVPDDDIDVQDIAQHTKDIGDPCLVVCVPNVNSSCVNKAKLLLAVKYLSTTPAFLENNAVLKKELDMLIDEAVADLNSWVESTFFPVTHAFTADGEQHIGTYGLNRLVSDICDAAYYATPIINHELINRHEISSPVLKARNTILTDLINGRDTTPYEVGTSAESTIFRAVMIHTQNDAGLRQAKAAIEAFVNGCIDRKTSFDEIVNTLMAPPFGMRKGVIAFYLLGSLLNLEDMPVIYFNNKEVIFDVAAVNSILKRPDAYFLFIEPETAQKNGFIGSLEELFSDYREYCRDVDKRNRLAKIACMMQSWYRSLPQTSMIFTEPDYDGQDMKSLVAFRKIFADLYLNPREVIFERIPRIFKGKDYNQILAAIKRIREDVDAHIHTIGKRAASIVRETFGFEPDADLRKSLMTWYDKLPDVAKNSVLSARADNCLSYIKRIATNDDEEIAGKLVYEATGTFIEDWKSGFHITFEECLGEVFDEITAKKEEQRSGNLQHVILTDENGEPVDRFFEFDSDNISSTATFFKSALEDMLEEYEGVLENNEKIGVLMDAIKHLMG